MRISTLDSTAVVARALAQPARLRIVAVLRSGELCVCQITEILKLAQSTVSTHLGELKRAGLITERKDGRWVYFTLAADREAKAWLDAVSATVAGDPQLEADQALAEELRRLPVEDVCRLGYEVAKTKATSSEGGAGAMKGGCG